MRQASPLLLLLFLLTGCLSDAPPLSAGARAFAVGLIVEEPDVRDATIVQEGDELRLVLIVTPETSESRARQLGDNFVRHVKRFAEAEPAPGKEVGSGVYEYMIGVYATPEEQIAFGAKVAAARKIAW